MTTPIEYQGKLELQDLLSGHRLAVRKAPRRRLHTFFQILVGSAVGIALAISRSALATVAVLFAAACIFYLYWRWQVVDTLRRRYARSRSRQITFRARFDEDGFRTMSSLSEDRRQWTDFLYWVEDANYFVLYESDAEFRIIPKRLVGGDVQVSQLRQLLTTHLGPAA
jgi:hypothetical protein